MEVDQEDFENLNEIVEKEADEAHRLREENEELKERMAGLENREPCEVAGHGDLERKLNESRKELTDLYNKSQNSKIKLRRNKKLEKRLAESKTLQIKTSLRLAEVLDQIGSSKTSQKLTKSATPSEIDLPE